MSKPTDSVPWNSEKLTKEMVDTARRELGETEESKKRCLAQIKNYVKEQDNIICPLDDDIFFLAFLRKSKFDMNKAIKLLHAYFREKKNFPEIFTPNYQGLKRCLEDQFASIMPYRDKDGCVVLVYRIDKWNLNDTKCFDIVHYMCVVLLAAVEFEPTQVCGVKAIVSAKGLSLRHIVHIQLRYLQLLARGVKSCLPVRIKGIHMIYDNVHVRFLWNLVKLYVGQKIRSRMHFHGTDVGSLQKYISPSLIPKEYGGDMVDDPEFCLKVLDVMKHTYIKRLTEAGYV